MLEVIYWWSFLKIVKQNISKLIFNLILITVLRSSELPIDI